jgi:hypothetical protein
MVVEPGARSSLSVLYDPQHDIGFYCIDLCVEEGYKVELGEVEMKANEYAAM